MFCCKQKTAYERRISDWSSDVCSSDLEEGTPHQEVRRLGGDVLRQFGEPLGRDDAREAALAPARHQVRQERKSVVSATSVSVRVDLGGRRIIKKKQTQRTALETITDSP